MTAFKKSHIITWAIDIIQKALWLLCVWRFATDFLVALPQNLHMLLYCKLPFSAITSGSLLILDIQACNKIKYIFPWFFFFSFSFSRLPDACKSCQDIQSHADAPVPDFGRCKGSGTVQSVVAAGFFFFFSFVYLFFFMPGLFELRTSPDCVSSTSAVFYLLTGLHPSLLPATCVVVQGNTHRPLHTLRAE